MPMIAHPVSARRACLGFLFLLGLLIGASPSMAAVPFPKPEGPVNDFAHVLSPPYARKITATIMELYRKTGIPVVVVTMPDIGGEDYNEYANRLYEAWGIGKKGEDKGVLVFLTLKERKMRIEVGYGLEGVIPDGLAGEIRDRYMTPYLRKDRFDEGLLNGVLEIAQTIAKASGVQLTGQAPAAPPQRKKRSALTFFPLILIFLFFLIFRRRRGGSWLLFLPLLMGGGRGPGYGSGGIGGGFGGFGGGFGGFGGGMSGGGGAGGGF